MRIAVLSTSYPRHPDDWSGHFVRDFARHLADAGHSITILAAGDGSRRESDEEGLRVIRIPGRSLFYRGGAPEALSHALNWAHVPPFVAQFAYEAHRLFRSADAIVSHWLLPSGLVGCGVARGRPHLALAHSSDVALCERLPFPAAIARTFSATGAKIGFVSENLRERFLALAAAATRRILASRSFVCPMGVDVQALSAPARLAEAGKLRALFLGRLIPLKAAPLVARVAAHTPGVSLHIAGDGPERSHLANAVCHGTVGFALKRELLHKADTLVLPSLNLNGRTEGAPLVLMEAMAAGLPVIATHTGGIPEYLHHEHTGLLVPPGDESALEKAFIRLRDDVPFRMRLGQAAAQAATSFDWSHVGARLFSALQNP